MKKFISLILIVFLTLTLFAGCKVKNPFKSETTENTKSNTSNVEDDTKSDDGGNGKSDDVKIPDGETVLGNHPNMFVMGKYPIAKDGKWGYINEKGSFVIKPQFDLAYPFDEDSKLALICIDGKFGYINDAGDVIIDAVYEDGLSFSEGFAAVNDGDKWGFIDESGSVMIDCQFESAGVFSNGLAFAEKNGKFGYIDNSGKFVIKPQFDFAEKFDENGIALVAKNDKFFLIDKSGKALCDKDYDGISHIGGKYYYTEKNQKCGYLILNGKKFSEIKPQFDTAENFSNGVAGVKLNGKIIIIDESGKTVAETDFDDIRTFNEGVAPFCKDDKWGFTDKSGKIVVDAKFDNIYTLSMKNRFAVCENGKWGVADKSGKYLSDDRFDDVFSNVYSDGYLIVKIGEKFAVMNKDGKLITNANFDNAAADNM